MTTTKSKFEYQYSSSQLDHTYGYLTTPLLTMLPPPSAPDLQHSFDAVISVEVIEHLSNPKALVTAAKYCLKPEGTFILTTPYHGYLKNLALAVSGKMDDHFTVLWDGGHIKFFSVSTLSKLLEAESCADIEFKYAGRIPYLWSSMLCMCKVN